MSNLFNFSGPPYQDYVLIGGKRTPGGCSIVKAGTPRTWQIATGYGLSGATLRYTGAGLSKFDVIVTLWEDDHWADWADFATVLKRPPSSVLAALSKSIFTDAFLGVALQNATPSALAIKHPILTTPPLSITAVVIEDVSQPTPSEWGDWDIVISCIEWRAPMASLGTVDGTIPKVEKKVLPARDQAEVVIDQLAGQFLSVAGK